MVHLGDPLRRWRPKHSAALSALVLLTVRVDFEAQFAGYLQLPDVVQPLSADRHERDRASPRHHRTRVEE
jgi:hypothetical protein